MDGQIIKSQRAKVLVQALPYIQKYWNRVVVIKYGGHAMESEELKRQVMEDIVLLQLVGVKVVLVHGGGPEINDLLSKLGVKSEFVNGLRVTDEETAQIVQMVLAGKVGKSLVNLIESTGGKAMGICGIDGKLIEAKSKSPALGYVGDITRVNVGPINDLLEKGYIPVVSSRRLRRRGQGLQHKRRHHGRAHLRRHGRGVPHLHDRHRRHHAKTRTTPRASCLTRT